MVVIVGVVLVVVGAVFVVCVVVVAGSVKLVTFLIQIAELNFIPT